MHKRILLAALLAAASVVCPARATLTSTCSSATLTGNGVTTAFTFSCKFLQASDISVTVAGVTKSQPTDYTVSGAGNASGTITFTTAPANGAAVVITRTVDYKQSTSLRQNRTYDPGTVEAALDKAAMQAQQLQNLYTNPPASILPANVTAKLNNIRFADQFATIQAAITDAGATGAVIIPSSFVGSDTFTNPNKIPVIDLRGGAGRWRNVVSVNDHGATGSGLDETAAVQAAANAVTVPGTLAFVGGNTYKINGTVSVPLGVSIDGNGAVLDVTSNTGVVFDYNVGGGVLSFNQPPTVFQRFRVNGNPVNTSTRLVQTFRVPYFTMRDVIAFSTNIAKVNGGNVLTKFDHVISYAPAGIVYWFTIGSDTFGANFTELTHCWIENAQNSGVVGVRIDKGDVRIHNSYFEQLPLMVWVNGGQVGLYDNSFNFRGYPAQGLLINSLDVPYGSNPPGSGEIIITGNDWGFGETTSAVNTQVMIETTVSLSLLFEGNKVNDFNSIASTPTTVFKTTSPNGQFFGVISGNKFYAQAQASFTDLLSVFDPTTVANAFSNLVVSENWFYGSSAAFPGQIDITKAGATGTIADSVFSGNQFLRATNLLRLTGGKISGNVFQTPPTITWSSSGGTLSDNVFNNGAPTVTGAGRVYLNSGFDLGTGAITLAAGTGTATVWSGCRPICTDTTANASVKCAVAATTLTATGTGTDVINYFCF